MSDASVGFQPYDGFMALNILKTEVNDDDNIDEQTHNLQIPQPKPLHPKIEEFRKKHQQAVESGERDEQMVNELHGS